MPSSQDLKERVLDVNKRLVEAGLVFLTFGNASAIDDSRRYVYIKPSGADVAKITAQDVSELTLTASKISGLTPSVDSAIHLTVYQDFPKIGGIIHTHSAYATIFAQAGLPIPCLGTTHSDYFNGEIPVTRPLRDDEINTNYELHIGKVIVETFGLNGIDPLEVPACLVRSHGPFIWGETIEQALENAIVLEKIAELAYHTISLKGNMPNQVAQSLLNKHFSRKHGQTSYYGQAKSGEK